MRIRWAWTGTVAAAALSLGATVSSAAGAGDSKSLELKLGHEQYMRYCSTCHGPDADGNGVASSLFTSKPTDLTVLAQKNGGKFPTNEILSIVKGDAPIAAHGKREMPVWGEVIGRPDQETMYSQAAADSRLMTIANYLESVQKK